MPKIEKPTGYTQASAWSHWAYLISIIDLGTQPGSQAFPTPKRMVKLQFELPLEKAVFDWVEKPLSVWATYSLSTGEKAKFRSVFEALFQGTPEDTDYCEINFDKLIGSPCTITLVENGEYINVTQVAPLTKWITLPPVYNELKVFDIDRLDEDKMQKVLNNLWEKMKEKIMSSPEYSTSKDGLDIPF